MIKRVVIFGGHIQALGLARQVAALRLNDRMSRDKSLNEPLALNDEHIEVILIVEDKYQVARFSRAVSKTYVCPTIDDRLKKIDELELPNRGTMLFPTNDEAVEMLCGRYDQYKERFALGVPEPKVIELFNDKRRAYRFAEASGVHCPKCWYPDTMEDVEALSEELPYPVVVKPAVMYSFHATFGKKAFRCDDAASLKATYMRIAAKGYPLETLVACLESATLDAAHLEGEETIGNIVCVEMKGLSRAECVLRMNACDLFALPSHSEGSPQALKEAMACNCPCLATDIADVKYLFGDEPGHWILRNPRKTHERWDGDENSLREMIELLNDALMFEGRTKGRERILKLELSNEQVAKRIVKIYENILH